MYPYPTCYYINVISDLIHSPANDRFGRNVIIETIVAHLDSTRHPQDSDSVPFFDTLEAHGHNAAAVTATQAILRRFSVDASGPFSQQIDFHGRKYRRRVITPLESSMKSHVGSMAYPIEEKYQSSTETEFRDDVFTGRGIIKVENSGHMKSPNPVDVLGLDQEALLDSENDPELAAAQQGPPEGSQFLHPAAISKASPKLVHPSLPEPDDVQSLSERLSSVHFSEKTPSFHFSHWMSSAHSIGRSSSGQAKSIDIKSTASPVPADWALQHKTYLPKGFSVASKSRGSCAIDDELEPSEFDATNVDVDFLDSSLTSGMGGQFYHFLGSTARDYD